MILEGTGTVVFSLSALPKTLPGADYSILFYLFFPPKNQAAAAQEIRAPPPSVDKTLGEAPGLFLWGEFRGSVVLKN